MSEQLFIGLISGTSMDGIDAALVSFGDRSLHVLRTHEHDYPPELRRQLMAARTDAAVTSVADVADLHRATGECFRDAALELLRSAATDAGQVAAIGSHGQTIRHEPDADEPYSLQIGDPDVIASGTGIATIARPNSTTRRPLCRRARSWCSKKSIRGSLDRL